MARVLNQDEAHDSLPDLEARLKEVCFGPGWNKEKPAMWAEPQTPFVPNLWSWATARAGLHSAGTLVDTKLAERRNLVLTNPTPGNIYSTLKTLVVAYQMIRRGEQARSHRHVPNALRLMIEGKGAYTVVNGVRYDMEPGDVLLTPGWTWHGHGNDGPDECYWLDYLDVPFVQMVEPMFFENHPFEYERVDPSLAAEPYRFRWVESFQQLQKQDPDQRLGRTLELNAEPLSTLSIFFHLIGSGIETQPFRSTANQIFSVKSGSGTSLVGDIKLEWKAGDVFAVPAWYPLKMQTEQESVLFRVSDERMQRRLNMFRTENV